MVRTSKIGDYNRSYCLLCKKQFKSNQSLRMHFMASKVHRKDSEFYHDLEKYDRSKIVEKENFLNQFKKINGDYK